MRFPSMSHNVNVRQSERPDAVLTLIKGSTLSTIPIKSILLTYLSIERLGEN